MASNKLLSIISRLGGPDIAHEEIEWVTDLPAGKQLVEWLESQMVEHSGAETDHNEMVWVAWKDIALEKDESSSYVSSHNVDIKQYCLRYWQYKGCRGFWSCFPGKTCAIRVSRLHPSV